MKARFILIKGQFFHFMLDSENRVHSEGDEEAKIGSGQRGALNIRNERLLTRDTGCENYANVARPSGSSPGQSVIHAACVHKRRDATKPRLSALFSSRGTLFPLG